MALMEISVVPLGTDSTSLGAFVVEFQKILKDSNLNFALNDMGTVIEGEIGELLEIAQKLHESPFLKGVSRVYTSIKIDDRRDKKVHLGDKTASVQSRL